MFGKAFSVSSFSVIALSLCSMFAFAEDAAQAASTVKGSAELGTVNNTGNAQSSTVKGKANLTWSLARWEHAFGLDALYIADEGVASSERYMGDYQGDYKFNGYDYAFVTARYDADRFSGYTYQAAETLGYGRQLWETDKSQLKLEVGAGVSQNKVESEPVQEEAIGRVAGNYLYKLSSSADFIEDITVESGKSNTYIESETGLKVSVVSNLGMKLSYNVKYNSDVPDDSVQTDTTTSVTLVYDF